MKRIDADIYFPDSRWSTTIWVSDNATEDEIREAILDEATSMIEIEYVERT